MWNRSQGVEGPVIPPAALLHGISPSVRVEGRRGSPAIVTRMPILSAYRAGHGYKGTYMNGVRTPPYSVGTDYFNRTLPALLVFLFALICTDTWLEALGVFVDSGTVEEAH